MTALSKFRQFFLFSLALICIQAQSAMAAPATPAASSHPGPTISVTVQRGDDVLPIYWVNHLKKGDKVIVTTDQAEKTDAKWLLLLATITPISNLVTTRAFDLTSDDKVANITITSDDQIPVVIVAPQVRTMFGLHTSFSESSKLVSDAIQADPQRFIDLQKIDQINHAITYLLHVLDAMLQTKKPDQAVETAKALAAKFGVKFLDPDCFKDGNVNTKCVAAYIVSSADLSVPSEDIWSAAGPNPDSVKLPTDFFAGLKLMTETTTYLANKYGDNYDFAPSLGQRLGASSTIQLFTNARFKSGDIKTAYVYVPSWFEGKTPDISMDTKNAACLTKKEMPAIVKGNLPLLNYWHDWSLVLREHGSDKILAQSQNVEFRPDANLFSVDYTESELPLNGQILDATLTGKFGFSAVKVNNFHVIMPATDTLLGQVMGLENLISGEQTKLVMKVKNGNACIEQMDLQIGDKTVASNVALAPPAVALVAPTMSGSTAAASPTTPPFNLPTELNADLAKVDAGSATLEVLQYGAPKQELAFRIFKRKAHPQKIVHHDLETVITITGDNLDRIDSIGLPNNLFCHPSDDNVGTNSRNFECPTDVALNANFPDKVAIRHIGSEPAAFEFTATKIGARPHMIIDGPNAVATRLSATALQWNLAPADAFVSVDSGQVFLLHAFGGYKLTHGSYQLQLKFADDPQTEATPITVPLMADLTHNELRTKKPLTFEAVSLPSIVNPIWYRVQHQPSGLTGDWQPLNRSIIYLPQVTAISCTADVTLVHGTQLELIDWASTDADHTEKSVMAQCGDEQCLELDELVAATKLNVKLHWIDNRVFNVNLPAAPSCTTPQPVSHQ